MTKNNKKKMKIDPVLKSLDLKNQKLMKIQKKTRKNNFLKHFFIS